MDFFKVDAKKHESIYAGQKGARVVNASLGMDLESVYRYMSVLFSSYNISEEVAAKQVFSKSVEFAVEPPREFVFKVAPLPGL